MPSRTSGWRSQGGMHPSSDKLDNSGSTESSATSIHREHLLASGRRRSCKGSEGHSSAAKSRTDRPRQLELSEQPDSNLCRVLLTLYDPDRQRPKLEVRSGIELCCARSSSKQICPVLSDSQACWSAGTRRRRTYTAQLSAYSRRLADGMVAAIKTWCHHIPASPLRSVQSQGPVPLQVLPR